MKNKLFFAGLLLGMALLTACGGGDRKQRSEFRDPSNKYRPKTLWFWNNATVTRAGIDSQILALHDLCGYGGVSILPFGADFKPEYLTDEYFDLYAYTVQRATELGMEMALYDEYGFPSGSAGAINGDDTPRFAQRHPELTIKRLDKMESLISGPNECLLTHYPEAARMAAVAMNTATLERVDLAEHFTGNSLRWSVPTGTWKVMVFLCVTDGDPNMDYLCPEAAQAYIDMTHETYYNLFPEAFGTTITQTFYDELTIYRAQGRVWTPAFNAEFEKRNGYSPALLYPALWYDIGVETASARNALFSLRSDLYAEAYPQAIDKWSHAHRTKATGHQDNEEVVNPVGTSGDLMKCFRYLEIPGIDKIFSDKNMDRPAEKFYKIISSSAHNWDHSLVMAETYGAMGNISWDSIYQIAVDQFAKGINVFIPHAAWYDNTKVTFPPELSSRNPLYAENLPEFCAFIGRLQFMLQNEARSVAETAVLYPIHTMQGDHYFDGPLRPYAGGVEIPYLDYIQVGERMYDSLGYNYTWLHPEVLAESCTVEEDGLKLNNPRQYNTFHTLVIPASRTISVTTLERARDLFRGGGRVIFTSLLPTLSAESGQDARVAELMAELLPDGLSNENEQGGKAIFIAEPTTVALADALAGRVPDLASPEAYPLRYIHKEQGGKSTFYLANAYPRDFSGEVVVRGKKRLEAWNPHTGEITKAETRRETRDGKIVTLINVEIPGRRSLLLVEK